LKSDLAAGAFFACIRAAPLLGWDGNGAVIPIRKKAVVFRAKNSIVEYQLFSAKM
jgi:hypothetical protein